MNLEKIVKGAIIIYDEKTAGEWRINVSEYMGKLGDKYMFKELFVSKSYQFMLGDIYSRRVDSVWAGTKNARVLTDSIEKFLEEYPEYQI